ncbi:MAG: trypsin-like peptidase domain-containing protein [Anaerolineae bacterium]|nr:trypsin-like peptidase domain-containing protein [Anaerolineae bacterium]MCA9892682.1 trypsin-like peptidase domain-containing protein [Anaerolineae bacterium]
MKKLSKWLVVAVTILVLGVFAFGPVFGQSTLAQDAGTTIEAQVFNQVSSSVVSITVYTSIGGGQGSGFVIDTEGHIVTNNHVVDGAEFIEVEFIDGTLAEGTIVGLDPDSDLAVIKVDLPAEKLHPLTFADSSALYIGQPVIAIGSPFGQEFTLTTGVVSATHRSIQGLTGFSVGEAIQTDAAINPGNSGGPLLNMNGEVIGVNSQILSNSNSSSGVGFAIPSNLTSRIAQLLINDGFVEYSYMGIGGTDVNLRLINSLNLPEDLRGVVVTQVVQGGPSARAGLQGPQMTTDGNGTEQLQGTDIITSINGFKLTSMEDLIAYLARETSPGDTAQLTVYRDGSYVTLDVRLTPRPSQTNS